jgi:hypothetical protein
MSATNRFRRLVLELGHGAADPQTMREAAAFARLLDAELHALFIEDETLLHASALPFTREISPVSYRWRPLEPDQLEAELRAAADRARRHLVEVARATGVRQNFEVRRGDLALHVTETCVAGDIVVVSPPRSPGNGTALGFRRLRETARRSAASVLFLPPGAGRRHGPVVAVVAGAGDPSLEVARRIATQQREGLMVLAPTGSEVGGEATIRFLAGNSAQDVVAALGETKERLIVMTRGDDARFTDPGSDPGAVLATARGVPVLEVEPS